MSKKSFACDFEATTNINDCRVWAFGVMEVGNLDNYTEGNNIDDFMKFMKKNKGSYYFHNLKYDGQFIIPWLFNNGFTYSEGKEKNTFSCVISSSGQFYEITIVYGYKGKNIQAARIYDSLKKIPFPIKTIAKAYDLPIMKGEIDYNKYRAPGHELTPDEKLYLRYDVEILARALAIQFEQGLTKMTIGSDSMNLYKKSVGKNFYKNHFPVLDIKADDEIRKAYKGGFTWVNPKIQGKEIGEGIVFDVNSLYPAQMRNKPMPYGLPLLFEGKYEHNDEYPLYIQSFTCEFELKENMIPTVQVKKTMFFSDNEYLSSSDGERITLTMTNVDYDLFMEHYEVYDVEYHNGYMFQSAVGLFTDHIDYWGHIKETSTGAIKTLAKLVLNNLYGKFASNPDVTGKIPYMDEDGIVKYKLGPQEKKDPVYTAVGCFITAWGRYETITAAQKCYDRICYCDTDSIHLMGTETPQAISDMIHDTKMGYWQHESTFKRAKFIRQKTYVEDIVVGDKIELNVKCAGMPDNIKKLVNFDNFEVGFQSNGKLIPKRTQGGVVLIPYTFSIK